jgi:TonB family protein
VALRRLLYLSGFTLSVANGYQESKDKDKDKDKEQPVVYTPGPDVKAPKVVHYVEPKSSSSSKEAFVEGVVRLTTVVTPDGMPSNVQVTKGLSSEEDHNAVEAVKEWRFEPGTKDGKPVHVRVAIEIDFHLL